MFNVIRRATAPGSLSSKTWRGADVAEALRADFLDKCYLCESREPLSFNVEHFDAHKGDDDKKYDWNNLFFACARCNNFKGAEVNVLDCTSPEIDVCRLIKHVPPVTPYSQRIVVEPMTDEPLVVGTADLLRKIYNQDDTGNRMVAGAYLRRKVFRKYYELITHINVYEDESSLPREKQYALEKMQHFMSKEHEYSAFLRWAILDSPQLAEILGRHID